MTREEEIKGAIEYILETHHYNYNSFEEARLVYVTVNGNNIDYDAMSLFIYSHTMDKELYLQLNRHLQIKYEEVSNNEDKKMRREYETLLLFFGKHREFEKSTITHITRPDFDIAMKTGERLGIEVTQLISEEDSVQDAITKECIIRGLTAEEIESVAKKKHGKKAEKYKYSGEGKRVRITNSAKRSGPQYRIYAEKIVSKLEKYKETKDKYDRFIILCDGRHPIFLSSKNDTESIIKIVEELYPEEYGAEIAIVWDNNKFLNGRLEYKCDIYEV